MIKNSVYGPAYKKRVIGRHGPERGPENFNSPLSAQAFLGVEGTQKRPCKWYLVEPVEGEFDEPEAAPDPRAGRLKCEPSKVVSRSGWWEAFVLPGEAASQWFEAGSKFPDIQSTEVGQVIWLFSPEMQLRDKPEELRDKPVGKSLWRAILGK
jgi:hypothetical protein